MIDWLREKFSNWYHEPLSERDKAQQVAIEIIQALLDQSKIPDLTPPDYAVELSCIADGGSSTQGNQIEAAFRVYVKVTPSNNAILRETLAERRKIGEMNAAFIAELEEKLRNE